MTTTSNAVAAARLYVARKHRHEHPHGRWDRGGRWWPHDSERCACCTVRTPSRAHPWSLMLHCRSFEHVCNLFGLTEAEIAEAKGIVRSIDPAVAEAKIKREETRLACVRRVVRHAVAALPQHDEGIVVRITELVEGVRSMRFLRDWLDMSPADALRDIACRAETKRDPLIRVWLRLATPAEEMAD